MKNLFVKGNCENAIAKIVAGDLSGLSVLYDNLSNLLFTIAFSILDDYHLAEDAMSETFLRVAEKAETYQKNTNAKAWVAAICRNISLKKLNENIRVVYWGEQDHIANNMSVELESTVEFDSILSGLTSDEKEIVVLKILWQFKHSQIANIMGITIENSRQKYKRALDKLKNDMQEELA